MYILELAVMKEHWEPKVDYIRRRVLLDRFRKVGNTGVVEIPGGVCTTTYAILENQWPVAWLYLRSRPGWAAYEVHQVYVMKTHRGQGLAQRLYRAAINTDGVLLATGKSHTKYSAAMWKRFITENMFNIWAHDFNDPRLRAQVLVDDDELICSLPIYADSGRHDVRFVAERKR